MSIPDFIDRYHLPPGEHEATLPEIEERFGKSSDKRVKVWKCFVNLLDRLEQLSLFPDEIYIDGSFVTGREEPGDVDFAALIKPGKVKRALRVADDHDKEAIQLFTNPTTQEAVRSLFGAHMLVADAPMAVYPYIDYFKRGERGIGLRDPDPLRDPSWVCKPKEKGIIKVLLNT